MKKLYIGTKFIAAEPMTAGNFLKLFPDRSVGAYYQEDEGYLVQYPDGYHSWSPEEVFEASYREISEREFSFMERRRTEI